LWKDPADSSSLRVNPLSLRRAQPSLPMTIGVGAASFARGGRFVLAGFLLCLEKHSLQYTGLPSVGLNGTNAVFPQSVHLASNIVFCDMFSPRLNLTGN
jgi:hypothetical protein